ncbi:hypothetical protein [Pseudorhodobacter wandonensis]|jgi:hypothetical protein|uniref:hypothetical protein n=1 Tax=Pseudorhodobacter wandonensis TaxID=1120568 RepID=UPI00067CBBB5|nr:hypothetical protein [Pseudorhodobacter wandonensis]
MFNKSEIMKAAWVQFRSIDVTKLSKRVRAIRFASCLRMAWAAAKRIIRAAIIPTPAECLDAQIAALENTDRLGVAGIARLSTLRTQAAHMAA